MPRTTDGDKSAAEFAKDLTERFKAMPWHRLRSTDRAIRDQAGLKVIDLSHDLLKVAKIDPKAAAKIWDDHVPEGAAPRPYELPPKAPERVDLNMIEPGRRRRKAQPEAYLDAPPSIGGTAGPGRDSDLPTAAPDRKAERARLLLEGLERQYIKADDKYHFRDRTGEVAFEAQHKRLLTQHDSPAVVTAMVDLAEARGWASLKLSGTPDFRREAWLEARIRGLEVSGYQPTKVDKARLSEIQAERLGRQTVNAMEHEPVRSPAPTLAFGTLVEEGRGEPRMPLTPTQDQFLKVMAATMRHRGDSAQAITKATDLARERLSSERIHVGKLVEVGTAPYQDKKGETQSHFVTLEDAGGKTLKVWGVDLPRALDESKAQPGQVVVVAFQGRRPIEVDVPVKDGKGQTLRMERTTVERNAWRVVPFDRLRDESKASVQKAVEHQEQPSKIRIFDRAMRPGPSVAKPAPSRPRSRERSL